MSKLFGGHQRACFAAWCAALLVSSGCRITIVSGPSTVTVGDTVTYVTEVGSSDGNSDVFLYFAADVPAGWQLGSTMFEGTILGVPTVIEATLVTSGTCGGVPVPGLQRYLFRAGPFPAAGSSDTGTATLTFDVESQPTGEYKIYFRFGGFGEAGPSVCSLFAVRTINRQGAVFLLFREAYFDGEGGIEGLAGASAVAATPDGLHVYVTAYDDDSIAVFARDPVSGDLTFVEALFDGSGGVDGLDRASGVAIAPDGLYLYVIAALDDSIAVFARDPATGELTFVQVLFDGSGGVDGLNAARAVAVSPDGAHTYVVAYEDQAIAAFARDPGTGELTFVQALFESTDGVTGLDRANALAVSPDGGTLYVTATGGSGNDSIAVFARDPASGELTFVQALFGGPEIEGLTGVSAVAVSPDGRHVYVGSTSSPEGGAVALFARDPATGELTFVEALFNLTDAAGGLNRVSAVDVSSGSHVFVTAANSVVVFVRERESGRLTFLEAQFQGDPPGQQGLEGANALTVVAGGLGDHVYIASEVDSAVVVFETLASIFTDGFESGDTSGWSG